MNVIGRAYLNRESFVNMNRAIATMNEHIASKSDLYFCFMILEIKWLF